MNHSNNGKFLLQLIHGLTHKQLFFFIWASIVSVFILMMVAWYKRNTRRNFRGPGEGSGPKINVDARQIGHAAKDVVPKNNSPTQRKHS